MPNGSTFDLIHEQTLPSDNWFTISSIPQTYRHLFLEIIGVGARNAGAATLAAVFNVDTGANYSSVWLEGSYTVANSGSNPNSTRMFVGYLPASSSTTNPTSLHGYAGMFIFDYSSSSVKKNVLSTTTDLVSVKRVNRYHCIWNSSSAISQIDIGDLFGNLKTGSIIRLWGIA